MTQYSRSSTPSATSTAYVRPVSLTGPITRARAARAPSGRSAQRSPARSGRRPGRPPGRSGPATGAGRRRAARGSSPGARGRSPTAFASSRCQRSISLLGRRSGSTPDHVQHQGHEAPQGRPRIGSLSHLRASLLGESSLGRPCPASVQVGPAAARLEARATARIDHRQRGTGRDAHPAVVPEGLPVGLHRRRAGRRSPRSSPVSRPPRRGAGRRAAGRAAQQRRAPSGRRARAGGMRVRAIQARPALERRRPGRGRGGAGRGRCTGVPQATSAVTASMAGPPSCDTLQSGAAPRAARGDHRRQREARPPRAPLGAGARLHPLDGGGVDPAPALMRNARPASSSRNTRPSVVAPRQPPVSGGRQQRQRVRQRGGPARSPASRRWRCPPGARPWPPGPRRAPPPPRPPCRRPRASRRRGRPRRPPRRVSSPASPGASVTRAHSRPSGRQHARRPRRAAGPGPRGDRVDHQRDRAGAAHPAPAGSARAGPGTRRPGGDGHVELGHRQVPGPRDHHHLAHGQLAGELLASSTGA